jgi:uncharacterized protein YdhG (YjbR/CyaY superfamily)
MATPPKSIDAYLKNVGEPRHTALQKLRRQIRTMVPGVEECISYSMPAFRWRGEVLGGFLATRKGCSFFPFSGTTLDTMAADLARYSRTKSALHFDPERGVPSTLRRKPLRTRQAEITGCEIESSFGSYHVGGAYFCLADGSARFVSDSIDRAVYAGLGSRDKGEVVGGF